MKYLKPISRENSKSWQMHEQMPKAETIPYIANTQSQIGRDILILWWIRSVKHNKGDSEFCPKNCNRGFWVQSQKLQQPVESDYIDDSIYDGLSTTSFFL